MQHFIVLSALALTATTMTAQKKIYPNAPKDGTVDTYFGVKIPDPFRPLEADRSKETAEWVAAENKITNEYLAKIPFRGKLLKRLKEVADYEKVGAPFKKNGKWYVFKNNGLQNQSVLYQMDELGGALHEFLDPNKLSTDGTVALQGISFSKDGRYMAYVISRSGSDWQEIYVKDVATGELLSDHIEWAKFGGAQWCGNGFYYSAYDAPEKGKEYSSKNEVHKVYYHKIGTPQGQDVLFYQNPAHPLRFYSVSLNKEETMMFLHESGAGSGMNLYVRDLRVPDAQFIQMTSNMDLQYSPIETVGDNIYLLTNDGAPRGRVMVADIHKPGFKDWKELIGESKGVLEDVQFADDKLVLTYSQDASTHLYVYSLEGKELNEIKLPTVGRAGFSGERGQKECFYSFASFTVPGTIYQYDMAQNKSTVYTEPKVKFDLGKYTTEQVFFISKDGTHVPMFLTYRKGLKHNGKNPILIYGYGGFNISLSPSFSSMRIPFLENAEAKRVRRLYFGCRMACYQQLHEQGPHRHHGRQQRRIARWCLHDTASRPV